MGRPKLLLPCADGTLIERVLTAWSRSRADRIVVVIRRDDDALIDPCRHFATAGRSSGEVGNAESDGPSVDRVCLVLPSIDPPDMKDSVAHAIRFLRSECSPGLDDAWLLAPADMPDLSPAVINALIAAHHPERPAILTPVCDGRRGHPVLFPWRWADDVLALGHDEGVNVLLRRFPTREVSVRALGLSIDIDTPEDYAEWRKRNSSLSEHPGDS